MESWLVAYRVSSCSLMLDIVSNDLENSTMRDGFNGHFFRALQHGDGLVHLVLDSWVEAGRDVCSILILAIEEAKHSVRIYFHFILHSP